MCLYIGHRISEEDSIISMVFGFECNLGITERTFNRQILLCITLESHIAQDAHFGRSQTSSHTLVLCDSTKECSVVKIIELLHVSVGAN